MPIEWLDRIKYLGFFIIRIAVGMIMLGLLKIDFSCVGIFYSLIINIVYNISY